MDIAFQKLSGFSKNFPHTKKHLRRINSTEMPVRLFLRRFARTILYNLLLQLILITKLHTIYDGDYRHAFP